MMKRKSIKGIAKSLLCSLIFAMSIAFSGCDKDEVTADCEDAQSCPKCSIKACCDPVGKCWYKCSDGVEFDIEPGHESDAAQAALSHCGCI